MISVGTILHDTYRIEEELGRGGMGRVFVASHTRLPRRFAVKVLMQATDGQALRRFKREAEICSQIGNQHIVEVFDFNEVDGQPYIVMELLAGESLRQVLDRHPVPPRTLAIQLVQEVGKALAAAHAAGVVHRDLKPENIFLCREDGVQRFKVLDFGISKIIGARSLQTREDMLLGTPGYMSPEQARGDVQAVCEKADQFALATIVYEALSGQAAFVAPEDTPYTVLYKIVHREPAPLFGQSPEVQRVLARAMAKQPEDRFADVSQLADAMVAALLRVPETLAAAPPAARRGGRPARWALLLAGAALVAAGTATALLVQRLRGQGRAPQETTLPVELARKPERVVATPPGAPPPTPAPAAIAPATPPVVAHAEAATTPAAPRAIKPAHVDKSTRPLKKPTAPGPAAPKPATRALDDELSNPYAPEKP